MARGDNILFMALAAAMTGDDNRGEGGGGGDGECGGSGDGQRRSGTTGRQDGATMVGGSDGDSKPAAAVAAAGTAAAAAVGAAGGRGVCGRGLGWAWRRDARDGERFARSCR